MIQKNRFLCSVFALLYSTAQYPMCTKVEDCIYRCFDKSCLVGFLYQKFIENCIESYICKPCFECCYQYNVRKKERLAEKRDASRAILNDLIQKKLLQKNNSLKIIHHCIMADELPDLTAQRLSLLIPILLYKYGCNTVQKWSSQSILPLLRVMRPFKNMGTRHDAEKANNFIVCSALAQLHNLTPHYFQVTIQETGYKQKPISLTIASRKNNIYVGHDVAALILQFTGFELHMKRQD